jgi:hypothetical protein
VKLNNQVYSFFWGTTNLFMKILPLFRFSLWACILFVYSNTVNAQLGLRSQYHTPSSPRWERAIFESSGSQTLDMRGFSIGLDYGFQLPNYRIEFYPEFTYSSMGRFSLNNSNYSWSQLSLKLNTHFYVFDFEEQCDCPTFNKQSPWLKKGFFLSLMIGGSQNSYETFFPAVTTTNNSSIIGSIGIGLDIGINDYVTITPTLAWQHWITPEWSGLSQGLNESLERTTLSGIVPGLRVGFYFYR